MQKPKELVEAAVQSLMAGGKFLSFDNIWARVHTMEPAARQLRGNGLRDAVVAATDSEAPAAETYRVNDKNVVSAEKAAKKRFADRRKRSANRTVEPTPEPTTEDEPEPAPKKKPSK